MLILQWVISFDKSCVGGGEGKGIPLLCKEIVFKNKIKRNMLFIYFYFVPNRCPLFNLQLPAQLGYLLGIPVAEINSVIPSACSV